MSANLPTGVKASSGYPQFSGVLTNPLFHRDLLDQFHCKNIFQAITTSDYIGDLKKCGDTVQFMHAPEVRNHKITKDGTIKHDTPEFKPEILTIDCAMGFSIKFAMIDEYQICDFEKIRKAILDSASRDAADKIDCDILSTIYAKAHPCNRGAKAGIQSKCYNMGEIGAPLKLDKDNILNFLIEMQAVLDEQCVPAENRWLVAPAKFKQIALISELREACWTGMSMSTMVNGKLPNMLAEFEVYISNHMSKVIDPVTGDTCYNLVAGWKGAAVYASQINQLRTMQSHNNWDHFYQGMTVYGHGVIRPEALVHAYVTLT